MNFRHLTAILALGAAFCLTPRAEAGPPLLCHPFEIGTAASLAWDGGTDWHSPNPAYDTSRLVPDTLALLGAETPILVRMETLRRAAIYSESQPRLAYELLSRLMARALSPQEGVKAAALALFDAGYLVETYRQARWGQKQPLVEGLDGYAWTVKAIRLGGDNPEMEFAASLMNGGGKWPNQHFKKALTSAPQGSLLARNLEQFKD